MKPATIALAVLLAFAFALACQNGEDPADTAPRDPTPVPEDDDDDDAAGPIDDDAPIDDDDTTSGFPRCPGFSDMILVPAGPFVFRYAGERYEDEGLDDAGMELPEYCIDEFEYPNVAGTFPTPVNWEEATELCGAAGKRLCSGEEWQKACTGPENHLFPWGDTFDDQICDTHTEDWQAREVATSGEWDQCVSGYGVVDMAGNLSEWTDEVWQDGWQDMTLRGGGFNVNPANAQSKEDDGFWRFQAYSQRCSSIHHHPPTVGLEDDGTRCCADPQ
jgi:Sulfatase-modifying factor enzyme 1